MSEDVGVLCSPVALFFAGVVATMSVIALLIALYAEMKALAWTSAALSVASSLVVAECFWGSWMGEEGGVLEWALYWVLCFAAGVLLGFAYHYWERVRK